MAGKVITGGRAKVYVAGQLVGIFESCTVSGSIGTEAIHILGKYSPDEIAITSQEAVAVSCSGFRVAGAGKHKLPKYPKVSDLLNFEPFTITVQDRQVAAGATAGMNLETIVGCVPNSNNTNYNSRATSRVQINYIGIRAADDGDTDQEESGASSLP